MNKTINNRRIQAAGILLILSILWYGPWMLANIFWEVAWLAIPFVLANLLIILTSLVTLTNNWHRSIPVPQTVAPGEEPTVGVLIPTCGEPVEMVARTIRSVLKQDWPLEKLRVVVGDDGHSAEVARVVEQIQQDYPTAIILYHEPPRRGEPLRRGDAKAGNLNSQLDLILERFSEVAFIETRDADDEVYDSSFLRQCLGQLQVSEKIAFVQTVKETHVSKGDPFSNNETLFYRGAMLARNASNAVFPCGSGLVWRLDALQNIGGFPTWNLVEDLQSGIEALRRGWRGIYLPIVGVLSQHAPEDIPNVYKQRGVWALDTMRLLLWGKVLKGLNFWQRLHFLELGLFYLLSFPIMVFLIVPSISLFFHTHALKTDAFTYSLHFLPFAISIELFLAALNGRQPYLCLWRAREMWVGLAVVYIKATWLAVVSGPNRKPAYRVTRKVHNFAWYWRETIVQIVLFVMLMGGILYALLSARTLEEFDLGTAYWAAFLGFILGGFVRKGWFGLNWFEQLKLLVTRRLIHPLYQLSATTLKTWEELFTPAQLPQLHLETEVLSWEPEVSSFLVAPIEVPAPAPAPTLLQQAGD